MVQYDFRSLNDKLKSLAAYQTWLPGGYIKNREYFVKNPTREDKTPGSFSVNIETGEFFDFSSGGKGHDLISLYAYINGTTNGNAYKELSEKYSNVETKPITQQEKRMKNDINLVSPVPDNATSLPTHRTLPQLDKYRMQIVINGKKQWFKYLITHFWPYHTEDGRISHYVVRYLMTKNKAKKRLLCAGVIKTNGIFTLSQNREYSIICTC